MSTADVGGFHIDYSVAAHWQMAQIIHFWNTQQDER